MQIKFDVDAKLTQLTDQEASRYALGHVQITPSAKGVWLTATNSKALAARYASGSASIETMCPAAALPAPSGRKPASVKWTDGRWENSKGQVTPQTTEPGRFPRTDGIFPEVNVVDYLALTLDAVLLHQVADAIADPLAKTRLVTLLIPKPSSCGTKAQGLSVVDSCVAALGPIGHIGLIMPCSGVPTPVATYEAARVAFVRDKIEARAVAEALEAAKKIAKIAADTALKSNVE